jgi:hypothetical protein
VWGFDVLPLAAGVVPFPAAVQAAAVATGQPVEDVARRWAAARPADRCVTPSIEPDSAAAVRAAYELARN